MKQEKHYWIEFIGDRSVKIAEGQSILSASLQAGIPHYHACGGQAKCSTCRVLIKDGAQLLSAPNEKEQVLRTHISLPPNVRLACQTFVNGAPVRLHRIIRDETDLTLYVKDESEDGHAMGEEKELALFFLDIRDFTPFMQNYLPFDIIHIMRRLFAIFRTCIESNGGRIIETAGDGLYAVFGLESDRLSEACCEGVNAGLCILEEMKCFNDNYLETFFNHDFEIGIGLHAGRAIVGNIGLGINNLTVMGLAVNIASRLQDATKELNNSFVVSETVARLIPLKDDCENTAMINLKGVEGAFKVHLLGMPFQHRVKA